MDGNFFFPAFEADDADLMIDENSPMGYSPSQQRQQPSQWQWPGQINTNPIPPANPIGLSQQMFPNDIFAQPQHPVPQPVVGAQMNAQVPQMAQMPYNPSPPLIPNNLINVPFFGGNGVSLDVPAQEQNSNTLFLGGGQSIAPNHSHYVHQTDPTPTPVKSHEDYGLGKEACRKLGDFPVHKPLAVFCMVCQKALPKFAVRCESCEEYARGQPPGTWELRCCILCESFTSHFEGIFCRNHSKQRIILSHSEKAALVQAGICNLCWQLDSTSGRKTCENCRKKRMERYYRGKKAKEEEHLAQEKDV